MATDVELLNRNILVMTSLRFSGLLILTALLISQLSSSMHAQSSGIHEIAIPDAPAANIAVLPGPVPPAPDPQSVGTIVGVVEDAHGADIPDATVTLENTSSGTERTITTDGSGSFKFDAVEPGHFTLVITSKGFESWTGTGLSLQTGQIYELPAVELKVAAAVTSVQSHLHPPRPRRRPDALSRKTARPSASSPSNFYASYIWNAAPLSSGQKFRLALRTSIDPVSIAIPAIIAGTERNPRTPSTAMAGNSGIRQTFRRLLHRLPDQHLLLLEPSLPSLLHQDPRYFYKGTGSIISRAFYAISTVVICKGDNGRWQPSTTPTSSAISPSASLSNAYYPANNRGVQLTIDNWLVGTGSGAIGALFQEFLVKKISRGVHTPNPPLGKPSSKSLNLPAPPTEVAPEKTRCFEGPRPQCLS